MKKQILKKLVRKLVRWCYPEIQVLEKDLDTDFIMNKNWDNSINKTVKLYPPYRVFDSEIGRYTYVSTNSFISRTAIGSFCSVGPNLVCGWGIHPIDGLSTSPMFYSTKKQNGFTLSLEDKIEERKTIVIGNDVFIGANVTILDGVTIGDGAVIGAGAVVSKDIPPYAIAVGCPIEVVRYRFGEEQIESLRRLEWWKFDDERLKEVERYFFDVDGFLLEEIEKAKE